MRPVKTTPGLKKARRLISRQFTRAGWRGLLIGESTDIRNALVALLDRAIARAQRREQEQKNA